jgi:hypothetical protein
MQEWHTSRKGWCSFCSETLPTLGLASGTNSVVEVGSGVVVVGGPAEQKIV